MKYIVWGCGHTGKIAIDFLGYHRVLGFASTDKVETYVKDKKVYTYDEMLDLYANDSQIIIVIASDKYCDEMEKAILGDGIKKYFVFHEEDVYKINEYYPYYHIYKRAHFLTYTEILSHYDFSELSNVIVYGRNRYIHYLLVELMEQASNVNISIFNENNCEDGYCLGIDCTSKQIDYSSTILINCRRTESDIRDRLNIKDCIDLYDIDSFIEQFRFSGIKKYKNKHKGERIFVIGNGPSLNYDDLEVLHKNKVVCIASNKIYKTFDKIAWRPDYILFEDGRVIEEIESAISEVTCEKIMADSFHFERNAKYEGVTYYHHIVEDYYPNYPGFSTDAEKGFYAGNTVTYTAIQLAQYMGANEIYLIGVDHSFVGNLVESKNHFIDGYFDESQVEIYKYYVPPIKKMTKAYEKANKAINAEGKSIYNATRGGKLEAFKRINFDDIF